MEIIIKAQHFAAKAHYGQKRKYTGEDYIAHPKTVASLLRAVHADDKMIAAAWLHDVVEDTDVTIDDIRAEFGDDVAELVDAVTDVSRPEYGNRTTRKRFDREHIAAATERAKCIKLADLIDNSRSITEHDPGFAKVYMREKSALLIAIVQDGLITGAGRELYRMASKIVLDYMDANPA